MRTTPVNETLHNARCTKFHRFAADVDSYNRAADEVMRSAGVPLVDLHAFTLPLMPAALTDHVHFTESTREQQGAFIASSIATLANAGLALSRSHPPA